MNQQTLICLRYTVLDEADELLSGGWEQALDMIVNGGGMQNFQTLFGNDKTNKNV